MLRARLTTIPQPKLAVYKINETEACRDPPDGRLLVVRFYPRTEELALVVRFYPQSAYTLGLRNSLSFAGSHFLSFAGSSLLSLGGRAPWPSRTSE